MNIINDLEMLDEFLNSDTFLTELDKMAANDPLCQEPKADFDQALKAVKPRLAFRECDAIDCANTGVAIAYAQLGVLLGMHIISSFQSALANHQALGDLIVKRMRRAKAAYQNKETEAAQECQ